MYIYFFFFKRVMTALTMPLMIQGAILGGSWYVWYFMIWTNHSHSTRSLLFDNVLGTALYFTAVATFCFHPKYYYLGFIGGSMLGMRLEQKYILHFLFFKIW